MTRISQGTLIAAVLAAGFALPLAAQIAPQRPGRGAGILPGGAGGIPSFQQIQQMRQQILALRETVRTFYDAKDAQNDKLATAASAKTGEFWSKTPDNLKNLINMRHPGSTARIERIISGKTETEAAPAKQEEPARTQGSLTITSDSDAPAESPSTAPADNAWIRDGNFVANDARPAATQPGNLWTNDGSKAPPLVATAGAPGAKAGPARIRQYRDDLDLFGDPQAAPTTQKAPDDQSRNRQNAQPPQQQPGRSPWQPGNRPGGFGGRRGR